MSSPTRRTLEHARKLGWDVQVVERWIPQARRRVDLFGGIDLVALDGQPGVLGIQATSANGGTVASRRRKLEGLEVLRRFLEAGNRLELWSWAKRGAAGKPKLWRVKRERARLEPEGLSWEVVGDAS